MTPMRYAEEWEISLLLKARISRPRMISSALSFARFILLSSRVDLSMFLFWFGLRRREIVPDLQDWPYLIVN